MMKLSVVIVSWNTKKILAECLDSLLPVMDRFNQNECQMEVIVVDNASSDGTLEIIQTQYDWVNLIDTGENLGFPAGNNRGFDACTGEYILLLNPDTVVHGQALELLMKFLDDNPKIGAVGSRLLNTDGSLQESCYPRPTLGREIWRLFHLDKLKPKGIYDMDSWSLETPRQVDVLMGACILCRRPIIEEIGGMDEEYFMYSEEVDLCFRIQKAGWQIFWLPEAQITHYGGQSTNLVKTEMFLRLYESKLLYFNKNYGRKAARFYRIVLYLASLPRLLLIPIAWVQRSHTRREKMLTLASQYWQLIQKLPGM
ncbi:MAG: glycosyltransferase family 2 protein [Anaerolineae bacterium]